MLFRRYVRCRGCAERPQGAEHGRAPAARGAHFPPAAENADCGHGASRARNRLHLTEIYASIEKEHIVLIFSVVCGIILEKKL